MWVIETQDGELIREADGVLWPDVPRDIEIRRLSWGTVELINHDAYGFQRFRLDVPGEGKVAEGAQLIGVRGGTATIIEITGKKFNRIQMPLSELTYDQRLLRNGTR